MKKRLPACDLEEGLILSGLVLQLTGLWLVCGVGIALVVIGVELLVLGCAIAFGR